MGMGESRGKKLYVPGLRPSRPVFAVIRLALVICCRGLSCLPERGVTSGGRSDFTVSMSFRVAARYVPMSSVAGDLYDYLIVDNRQVGLPRLH